MGEIRAGESNLVLESGLFTMQPKPLVESSSINSIHASEETAKFRQRTIPSHPSVQPMPKAATTVTAVTSQGSTAKSKSPPTCYSDPSPAAAPQIFTCRNMPWIYT